MLMLVSSFNTFGQNPKDSLSVENNIISVEVPDELNIKDKIIIRNKSPYLILQAVVAYDDYGILIPLGTASYVAQDDIYTVASFKGNKLKKLRGKRLAIKIKGAKVFVGRSRTDIGLGSTFGFGSLGVNHTRIPAELVNNIKPEDITYNFDVTLFESSHDLYIDVLSNGEQGFMDF